MSRKWAHTGIKSLKEAFNMATKKKAAKKKKKK
jgi:hypothetical protein